MTTNEILLIALALLQLGDYYTTVTILKNGGRELNPIMKKLMDIMGVKPALVFKGVAVVLACYAYTPVPYLWFVVVGYCLIVLFNMRSMP